MIFNISFAFKGSVQPIDNWFEDEASLIFPNVIFRSRLHQRMTPEQFKILSANLFTNFVYQLLSYKLHDYRL